MEQANHLTAQLVISFVEILGVLTLLKAMWPDIVRTVVYLIRATRPLLRELGLDEAGGHCSKRKRCEGQLRSEERKRRKPGGANPVDQCPARPAGSAEHLKPRSHLR
jgi:hypothetical protein